MGTRATGCCVDAGSNRADRLGQNAPDHYRLQQRVSELLKSRENVQNEYQTLSASLQERDAELTRLNATMEKLQKERDALESKNQELNSRIQHIERHDGDHKTLFD